jgi:hypothetical protein
MAEVEIDRVLKDSRVRALTKSSVEREALAQKAVDYIRGKFRTLHFEETVRSIVKGLDAKKNAVTVFIAYQEEDAAVADCLKGRLEEFGSDRLDVHTFTDRRDNAGGEQWRQTMIAKIKRSNWFIAILPDEKTGSRWPLYEAAVFEGSKTATDLLIVVTRPGAARPEQLEDYHGFVGNVDEMFQMFDQLMREPNQLPGWGPVHPHLRDDTVQAAAEEVAREFRESAKPVEWEFFVKYVELDVSGMTSATGKPPGVLDAKVLSCKGAEEIFGVSDKVAVGRPFGDVIKAIYDERHGKAWISELGKAVKDVLAGRVPTPVRTSFCAFEEGRDFHPHLSSMSRSTAGPFSVRVTFTPSLLARVSNVPRALDAFMTTVRLSHRFRWELLEQFQGGIRSSEDVERFERLLVRMETEGMVSGTLDPSLVLEEVEDESHRATIARIYKEWEVLRTEEGDLTKALNTGNAELLKKTLPKLWVLNRDFMRVAVAAAPGVVMKHWR